MSLNKWRTQCPHRSQAHARSNQLMWASVYSHNRHGWSEIKTKRACEQKLKWFGWKWLLSLVAGSLSTNEKKWLSFISMRLAKVFFIAWHSSNITVKGLKKTFATCEIKHSQRKSVVAANWWIVQPFSPIHHFIIPYRMRSLIKSEHNKRDKKKSHAS